MPMDIYKKSQAVLEYSLLIAVCVGVMLIMRFYIQRSVQGNIQIFGDQVGEQYQAADTKNYELYTSQASINEIDAPGWDHPTTTITTSGSYGAQKQRQLHLW